MQCLPSWIQKRVIIIVSTLFASFSLLYVGPSSIFGFQDSLLSMIVGQLLLGLCMPFMLIPALPEMAESALEHYDKTIHERVNNMSSAIFTTFLGIGQCLGPIFGSISFANLGFRLTSDIMVFINLTFALLYFTFAGGVPAFKLTLFGVNKNN